VCKQDETSFLLHSSYDPCKEAQRFIAQQISEMHGEQKIVVYGLACAYHIRELLKQTEGGQRIEIWEWNRNFYDFIKNEIEIEDILEDSRVSLYVSDDKQYILNKWQEIDEHSDYLILHSPSLKIIPDDLKELKTLLQNHQVRKNSILANREQLITNFDINIRNARLDYRGVLTDILKNTPVVLASAGPSLSRNLKDLRKNRDRVLLASVGTALSPLVNVDVIPDLLMMTDSSEKLYEQFADLDADILSSIPLFYLGSVSPEVIDRYPGPKIMLLQAGMEKAEELLLKANIVPVETGGSVATTLLDFIVKLGTSAVCFIGQDLAYTGQQTHAKGTHNYRQLTVLNTDNLIEVDNYSLDGKVYSPRSLYIYKRWIEHYIAKHQELRFFNATGAGAYIKGCDHVDLKQFIKEMPLEFDIDSKRKEFKAKIDLLYRGE